MREARTHAAWRATRRRGRGAVDVSWTGNSEVSAPGRTMVAASKNLFPIFKNLFLKNTFQQLLPFGDDSNSPPDLGERG